MESLDLGKKIRFFRTEAGLSVRTLASRANITPSMLSQIENGQVNPSVSTLRAISQVVEIPLYTFFMDETDEDPVVHVHTRKTLGIKSEPDIQYELLTPDTKGDIEFCMMVIPPHLNSYRDIRSHAGEEVAYMVSGESVDLEIEGHIYNLVPGDSVRIPPKSRHSWHNRTDTPVNVIFAITPPSF